jgi:hypothetical protein
MATVLKFLQQWQGGQARQAIAIDNTLDPAIARAISNQIAVKVQEATLDTTTRLIDLQAETDALIIENERQAIELESKTAELEALHQQHSALAGRVHQLETDAERTNALLNTERQTAEAARVELAKSQLRLEALPRIEAENEKIRAELLQARAHAAEQHESAAIATAKLEAEITHRQISAESFAEKAAREIGKIQDEALKASSDAQKAREEAAELRGQLAEAKNKPAAATKKLVKLATVKAAKKA